MSHNDSFSRLLKMNSHVFIMFILSGLGTGDWVEVPFVFPKSRGTVQENSSFVDLVPNEFYCPDIHNLTMSTYSTLQKSVENLDFKETWTSITVPPETLRLEAKASVKAGSDSDEKLLFLKSTEKTLISKIEEKIKRFGMTREARGKHVDFPSMESALITISLLLFAVYLIKLVMKILQSLQAKKGQMQMTPMSGLLVQGRKRRSVDAHLEHVKLLHVIDKYNSLFG